VVAGKSFPQTVPQHRVFVQQPQQVDETVGGGAAQVVLEQTGLAVRSVGFNAEDVAQERARNGVTVMDLTG
jgi:hypothetical protein